MSVYDEIRAERDRQDERWGGPEHDDTHRAPDWENLIKEYQDKAREAAFAPYTHRVASPKWRRRMIQTAALAIAAAEWFDRVAVEEVRLPR